MRWRSSSDIKWAGAAMYWLSWTIKNLINFMLTCLNTPARRERFLLWFQFLNNIQNLFSIVMKPGASCTGLDKRILDSNLACMSWNWFKRSGLLGFVGPGSCDGMRWQQTWSHKSWASFGKWSKWLASDNTREERHKWKKWKKKCF